MADWLHEVLVAVALIALGTVFCMAVFAVMGI